MMRRVRDCLAEAPRLPDAQNTDDVSTKKKGQELWCGQILVATIVNKKFEWCDAANVIWGQDARAEAKTAYC